MNTESIAIIQARMGSSRFPGKSLASVGRWSIIELVLRRVNLAKRVDKVILATSTNPIDDVLCELVTGLGFNVSRGSEYDVLSRFFDAAKPYAPKFVVRVTGDCPLISPILVDYAIENFVSSNVDYLTLSIGAEKVLAYPRGFDVEVANFRALKEAAENAKEDYEREHVMPYLYANKNRFLTKILEPEPEASRPTYRLCVDTKEDLEVILKMHEAFGEQLMAVDYREIIEFLDAHPEIVKINQSIKQKHFTESDKRIRQ